MLYLCLCSENELAITPAIPILVWEVFYVAARTFGRYIFEYISSSICVMASEERLEEADAAVIDSLQSHFNVVDFIQLLYFKRVSLS